MSKCTTTKRDEKCTLFITRASGVDFMVHFNSYKSAWDSSLDVFRQIELIEGEEPIISNGWDKKTGYQTCSLPLNKSGAFDYSNLCNLWINQPDSFIYFIGAGSGYQLVLLKGLVYKPLNNVCISTSIKSAIYYMNMNDDQMSCIPFNKQNVYVFA